MPRTLLLLVAVWGGAVSAHAQRPPNLPLVRHGICPWECCSLGDWTAHEPLTAHPTPRDTARIAFRIGPGDQVLADSADLYTLMYGVVIIRRPVRLAAYIDVDTTRPPATRDDSTALDLGRRTFMPGDTLLLIEHVPEVGDRAWTRYGTVVVAPFWEEEAGERPDAPAEQRQAAVQEWWAHVRTKTGTAGWIQVLGHDIGPVDTCGDASPDPGRRNRPRANPRTG
jgi:hypothetical protein